MEHSPHPVTRVAHRRRAPDQPRVQSVARAVQILDLVARSIEGLTATEISIATDINRSATYHLLHTLSQTKVLDRVGRRYVIGTRAGVVALGFTRHRVPQHAVAKSAHLLADSLGHPVSISVWRDADVTLVGQAGTRRVLGVPQPGFSADAHARAAGKLLLSLGTQEERDQYLATHQLLARTSKTITDRRRFERELEMISARGYAVDDREFQSDVCCVAAPLATRNGVVALTVISSADEFPARRDHILATLQDVDNHVGIALLDL